jgi:hypothetical protein
MQTLRLGVARYAPLRTRAQVGELALQACFVVPPRDPVDPGGGFLDYRPERVFEGLRRNVVQQRDELLLSVAPCGLPHALPRL